MLVNDYIVGVCKGGLNQANLVNEKKEHTKGKDFHGKSLKRSFVPPPPPPTQSRIYMT
jgi:hypothetical protein